MIAGAKVSFKTVNKKMCLIQKLQYREDIDDYSSNCEQENVDQIKFLPPECNRQLLCILSKPSPEQKKIKFIKL